MQSLRRAAPACRQLVAQWEGCLQHPSALQQLQQAAPFAKKSGESVDGKLQRVLKMLEPVDIEDVPVSEEEYQEGMRRAKEYSRLKMRQHRAWQANLSCKLGLKLAAVAALPPALRAAAEEPDDALFPINRHMWSETPPIEGFGQAAPGVQQAGLKKMGTKHRNA